MQTEVLGTAFLILPFITQCFPNIMHTSYKAEIYIFSVAKIVLHIKARFQSLYSPWVGPSSVSNALEIREDPSEVKRYLTWGETLKEPFSITLGQTLCLPHLQRYGRSHTYR